MTTGCNEPAPAPGAPAGDIVDWAIRTGRVQASSRPTWLRRFAEDRDGTNATLRILASSGLTADEMADMKAFSARVAASASDDWLSWVEPSAAVRAAGGVPGTTGYGTRQPAITPELLAQVPPPPGPKPTPFTNGQLPAVTASGAAPTLLARVNMGSDDRTIQARLILAYTPSLADFMRLYEEFTGPDAEAITAPLYGPALEAWDDYQSRVRFWLMGSPKPAELPIVTPYDSARANPGHQGGVVSAAAPYRRTSSPRGS